MMTKYLAIIFVCVGLASGCSNVKPYKITSPGNLSLKAKTDSDVKAAVDIYSVDKACKLTYQGTVDVGNKFKKVGIPMNKPSYLVINFSKSSFWSGQSSNMSQEALLTAKKGYRYQIDMSYVDYIYDIQVKRIHRKSGKSRAIELAGLGACGK